MQAIKTAIWGVDPQEQVRKCNSLLRRNQRELDRHLTSLSGLESKTKLLIKNSAKRNDIKSARTLAKELYNIRRQRSRLYKSKATLSSVGMQMNEAFALRKIQGTIQSSTSILKDVNGLVRLPELTGSMQQLSQELTKAGIIDEMVSDTLDNIDQTEDEMDDVMANTEVDNILSEITNGKLGQAGHVPQMQPEPVIPELPQEQVEEDEESLDNMRQRLKALQS